MTARTVESPLPGGATLLLAIASSPIAGRRTRVAAGLEIRRSRKPDESDRRRMKG
jgi:hypothetical protein